MRRRIVKKLLKRDMAQPYSKQRYTGSRKLRRGRRAMLRFLPSCRDRGHLPGRRPDDYHSFENKDTDRPEWAVFVDKEGKITGAFHWGVQCPIGDVPDNLLRLVEDCSPESPGPEGGIPSVTPCVVDVDDNYPNP